MQYSFQNSAFILTLLIASSTHASEKRKPCFDFETKVIAPLKPAPTQFENGKDTSELEEGKDKNTASVSGLVQKPILELYQKLLDPKTIRDGKNVEVLIKTTDSKDYLKRVTQSIKITPVFFLTLRWTEEWVYALKDGTAEAPKTLVISHEKTSGTSHIQHLCGNFVLQSLSPTSTGVFIYQELKADRRDAKNILDDITGTLRDLRGLKKDS